MSRRMAFYKPQFKIQQGTFPPQSRISGKEAGKNGRSPSVFSAPPMMRRYMCLRQSKTRTSLAMEREAPPYNDAVIDDGEGRQKAGRDGLARVDFRNQGFGKGTWAGSRSDRSGSEQSSKPGGGKHAQRGRRQGQQARREQAARG
ncbi:hypothetical protein FQN51_003594 [Onygenales sp. PD_10]|nr:hypothetical protein FQN51_003594 [Onygenales sp. PD_10]